MIVIGGGMYLERCQFPSWEHVYGSAGRAAASIAAHHSKLLVSTLSTKAGEGSKSTIAAAFGFDVTFESHANDILFTYTHPLAVPTITPPLHTLTRTKTLHAAGKVVLRFGMVEGTVVADGERVVYDPQNVHMPEPFHDNGSKARTLAVVCNRREGSQLTKKREPAAIAEALMHSHRAEVVVVKCGSSGALVKTSRSSKMIPSYSAEEVFSIGSGDVFSAMFTYFWGLKKTSPFQAADLASRATARYCATRTLPIPKNFATANDVTLVANNVLAKGGRAAKKYDVYLAGPFFSMSQRWLIEETRRSLMDMGLRVFSPIHDVGGGADTKVAQADLKALHKSAVLFGILDGMDPGTLFEFGYAHSIGLPAIAFLDRPTGIDLKMVSGTGTRIFKDFASAVYATAWTAHA